MKFKPQRVDKVHGNDFIYNSFGPNANLYHKNFKAFFACHYHLIKTPPKTQYPNWRVQPLLMWVDFIFPLIWMLGVALSIDEMTMRFKGHHTEKMRMIYNEEGDVL